MGTPEWSFSKMRKDEMNIDPVLKEFFRSAELTENLVRESIQNSLDARREGQSGVRVRFAFSSPERELSSEESRNYTRGLWPHLQAVSPDDMPEADESMKFITIEDFGTKGLRGDPGQYDDSQPSVRKNDFFYFWRNYGRSSKHETQLGRWGVGKTVFAESSKASSFFGLTVREDDHKHLLMGQSVLKTHTIDTTRFAPYGFYAQLDNEDFPLPIEENKVLAEFSNKFGLTRTDEPGLSVVIPYYKDSELTKDNLERAVIQHYFYPILTKELVVEIAEVG